MNAYYDYKSPASFGGITRLAKETHVKKSEALKYLQSQDTYTKFKPNKRRFIRRKFIAYAKHDLFQADLADMQKYSRENNGYRYILVVVDVLSKYVYYVPTKSKKPKDIKAAFASIFRKATPKNLLVDRGSEFFNREMNAFFKKHAVNRYYTYSEMKAAVAERHIRTLKERLERIFHYRGSHRYIDVLSHLADSYNARKHTTTGIAPMDVTRENEMQVFQKIYAHPRRSSIKPKLRVGDNVRISLIRGTFAKGYEKNWSDEIFIVDTIKMSDPIVYYIKDMQGENILGGFYDQEISKVDLPDYWDVEKVVNKRRTRGGKTQYLVKFVGYPDLYWTDEIKKK